MKQRHLVVMGVSGCGKSTIGRALAAHLDVPFAEGDDFHSDMNRAKMAAGIALDDSDRVPWLVSLRDWMTSQRRDGIDVASVTACSALKRAYRDILREATGDVIFIHAITSPQILATRMEERTDHYMPPSLLASQLEILEPLGSEEAGLTIEAEQDLDTIVESIDERLGLGSQTIIRSGQQ